MKLLVINGPNLNMLGIREPDHYGKETYQDLIDKIQDYCDELMIDVEFYQSNYEGDIVTCIQKAYQVYDGIIINPGAYTHTSIAILDALKAVQIPTVEVHISQVDQRESFRQLSYVSYYASLTIKGHGTKGYLEAVDYFLEKETL